MVTPFSILDLRFMVTPFSILDLRFLVTLWYLRFTVSGYPLGILFTVSGYPFGILDLRLPPLVS